jgi:iron complex transport system ATP-binding protein
MLEAQNITVTKGGKELLAGVSLTARAGAVTAVLGANGAGKSTLLKVLTGEIKSADGAVRLGGQALRQWDATELARARAVLPQSFALNFPFKAFEVALLGRAPHVRFSETERDKAIARAALAQVEAAEFSARLYPTLSGGEKQRVQLARVLAQIWEPPAGGARYLLLDEPTASLDLAHQHQTLRTARQFASAGVCVLAVLHDLNLAAQYADEILLLQAGQVYTQGSPQAVLTPANIKEVFGLEALVTEHPQIRAPLVIPVGAGH